LFQNFVTYLILLHFSCISEWWTLLLMHFLSKEAASVFSTMFITGLWIRNDLFWIRIRLLRKFRLRGSDSGSYSGSGSCFGSGNAGLRLERVAQQTHTLFAEITTTFISVGNLSFVGKYFFEKKVFIYFSCAFCWEIMNFTREVLFQIHSGKGLPRSGSEWFIPDPAKSYGSDRIRIWLPIRIHNTALYYVAVFMKQPKSLFSFLSTKWQSKCVETTGTEQYGLVLKNPSHDTVPFSSVGSRCTFFYVKP